MFTLINVTLALPLIVRTLAPLPLITTSSCAFIVILSKISAFVNSYVPFLITIVWLPPKAVFFAIASAIVLNGASLEPVGVWACDCSST